MTDVRATVASHYDRSTKGRNDIPFYKRRVAGGGLAVLELGCGTGRVLLEFATHCKRVVGVEVSQSMLVHSEAKVEALQCSDRVRLVRQDIARFDIGGRFEFIFAPFRILQNIESVDDTDSLLASLHGHLTPPSCTRKKGPE